jgi:circadian clock protein KaiB
VRARIEPLWGWPGQEAFVSVTVFSFRLYVTGQTEVTQVAQANLRRLCESRLAGRYELEVVDTIEQADRAEADRVLATPTVLRLAPEPQRRVVGDLSDPSRAATALGLPDPDASKESDAL